MPQGNELDRKAKNRSDLNAEEKVLLTPKPRTYQSRKQPIEPV